MGSRSLLILLLLCWCVGRADVLRVPGDHPTINGAIAAAANGDTIIVAPGIYNESVDFTGKAVTVASQFIEHSNAAAIAQTVISPPAYQSAVLATSGEDVSSRLIGFSITGCRGLNVAPLWCYQGSLTILHNRIFTNYTRAVVFYQSHSILRHNEIYGNPVGQDSVIHSAQAGPTIEQNTIKTVDRVNSVRAIYHSTTGPATNFNTIIRGNIIYGMVEPEFHVGGSRHLISHNLIVIENGYSAALTVNGADDGLLIENNTLVFGSLWIQRSTAPGPHIRNNIVAFSGYGIESMFPLQPVSSIAFNNVWPCLSGECGARYTGYPDQTGLNGNISVGPLFVSVTNRDFRLKVASPSIDAGDPEAVDPDGTRRDQGAFPFLQDYGGWLQRHFSATVLGNTNSYANVWGPHADPDHDGAGNLAEFFAALNPLAADSQGGRLAVRFEEGNLVLTFQMRRQLLGVAYKVQRSADLLDWVDSATEEVSVTPGNGAMQVRLQPAVAPGKSFFRLHIIPPP